MPMIYVFASNLAGRHGKGSAFFARKNRGAVYGVGVGRTGNAYAIPTKDGSLNVLPLSRIAAYVADFIAYAKANPYLDFEVVKVGCGLAGYSEEEMSPMFKDAPHNCHLPEGWR